MSDRPARSFVQVILDHNHGDLNAHCSDEFKKLVEAIDHLAEQNGTAKGEFTLKLKLKGERGGIVQVMPEAKVKAPTGGVTSATFFVDKNLNLVAQDPRQLNLEEVTKLDTRRPVEKV